MHSDFEFKQVSLLSIENKRITKTNLEVLTNLGLPGFVSPHLYFGDFEENQLLPFLSDWTWASEWKGNLNNAIVNFNHCYVIGCGQASEPILLKPNESEVYQVSDDGKNLVYVNSDLGTLYRTLDAFLTTIESALTNDSQALLKQRISPKSFNIFREELSEIDPIATTSNYLWDELVDACSLFCTDV